MRGLYPTPDWQINDEYKIDKALLFAVIRRESAFNFKAKSLKEQEFNANNAEQQVKLIMIID